MQVFATPKLNHVDITSDFWKRYRELVVKEVLPYQWQVMNDEADIAIADDPQNNGQDKNSHAVANLKIAAGEMEGHHYGSHSKTPTFTSGWKPQPIRLVTIQTMI